MNFWQADLGELQWNDILIDYIFIIAITLREYAEDLKVISLTESHKFCNVVFCRMIIGAFWA